MPELILVVDDEKDLVHTLEYNLRRGGYRIRSACTGQGFTRSPELPGRVPAAFVVSSFQPTAATPGQKRNSPNP